MGVVRPAAVAGTFYPADPTELRRSVADMLERAVPTRLDVRPEILIVPHAAHVYSGTVAAVAYRALGDHRAGVRRVLLAGPSHHVWCSGLAGPGADALETPLGEVAVDRGLGEAVRAMPGVIDDPFAHAREHCIEVQLPFLQVLVGEFTVLPLVTGDVEPEDVADVLAAVIGPGDVVCVISSDLSHYLDHATAEAQDRRTAAAILELRADDVGPDDACGSTALRAGLILARRAGWVCRLLDLRNSGDTAGGRQRVVGYGAFAIGPQR